MSDMLEAAVPVWNAAREIAQRKLVEEHGAGLDLIADATGRSLRILRKRATAEGWMLAGADARIVERLRHAALSIARRVEVVLGEPGTADALDKAEMDALNSAVRVTEKLIEILSPDEVIQENARYQNADLADVLELLNGKIIELAGEIAAGVVARDAGRTGADG